MQKPQIEIASDAEDLARRMVTVFVSTAREAVTVRGVFHTALSGGRTPERFFRQLAVAPEARTAPWDRTQIFWVDERYVPPDSPDSNYGLAAETFVNQIGIPEANVHRIPTEYSDINDAARDYERTIRGVFGLQEGEIPQFDLIVLGMGADGHTGSLFPDSYAAYDTDDLACVVYVNGAGATHATTPHNRVTLTCPVLLAARRLVVLVSGQEKAQTLKEVLLGEPDEVRYPIHVLWPVLDKVLWLVDRDAAGEIAEA